MLSIKRQDIFSYNLPQDKIAQRPVYPYDSAKLLVCDKNTNIVKESAFSNISDYLSCNDLIIFNNTKVIPARFLGHIEREGELGAKAEILLLKKINENLWEALGKPFKKFKAGTKIIVDENLSLKIEKILDNAKVIISFITYNEKSILEKGIMPIPPYIRKGISDKQDRVDYQTNFAKIDGSVAAPTASLHFTKELLEKIEKKGVKKEFITLHVGTPSFLPLWQNDDESNNDMNVSALPGEEFYIYSKNVIQKIKDTKETGGKVIAVGTTVIRALESMALNTDGVDGEFYSTSLFISPGFEFKFVDTMVTNFHQPATSHILLVQAFMGKDLLQKSYTFALENNFRFLSYGDGMIVGDGVI